MQRTDTHFCSFTGILGIRKYMYVLCNIFIALVGGVVSFRLFFASYPSDHVMPLNSRVMVRLGES